MKYIITSCLIFILHFSGFAQAGAAKHNALGLTFSFPWVNNYSFYDYDLKKSVSKSGFIGLGGSVFYKKDKNKIALNAGFTGDLPAPMGAFDYGKEGTRTNIGSVFIEGLYHHRIYDRIDVIGGINYVSYKFNFTSYVASIPSYTKRDGTFGVTMGTAYSFSKSFSLALFYRPALVLVDAKQYTHLISLDARFDINVLKW